MATVSSWSPRWPESPQKAARNRMTQRRHDGRLSMLARCSLGAMALAAFCLTIGSAQALYDAILADQKAGGTGNWPSTFCVPQGMPAMMNLFDPMEIVITLKTTYILISHINDSYRRIYTDGRDWPAPEEVDPTF